MAGNSVGILALQGAVAPHEEKLRALDVQPVQIRKASQLDEIRGIILPGGESTAMIHLLKVNKLWEPLKEFCRHHATWGICAGAILLARQVASPTQESLALLDIEIERNAFGRQKDSFIDQLKPSQFWIDSEGVEGVFIRAPKIRSIRGRTKPLLYWNEEIVMVEEDKLLASTFHPELTDSLKIHKYFLQKCEA